MISRTSLTRTAFFALTAGLLFAPAALAQKVSVDFDRQADFAKCTTYAWAKGQPAQNPLADRRIVEAIDEALTGKGWKKVDQDPTCYVVYQASVKEQKGAQVWGGGWGPGWRFGGGTADVRITSVLQGMLVVDIADAGKKQVIWRGVATDTVSDKPEKNEKKLREVMDKMFKQFPPGSMKK